MRQQLDKYAGKHQPGCLVPTAAEIKCPSAQRYFTERVIGLRIVRVVARYQGQKLVLAHNLAILDCDWRIPF
jgi:hypothetical protein